MPTVYKYFREFTALDADRLGVLKKILSLYSLPFSMVPIEDSLHIFISPDIASAVKSGGTCVLIAHYDRVPGSPGANDNSAAVFQLIEAAVRLCREQKDGWLIIFTDKEEIAPEGSIRDQGSYGLGKILYEIGVRGGLFYIFDACGTGDTLVISTTVDYLLKDKDGKDIKPLALDKRRDGSGKPLSGIPVREW